jgi:hypothetical protein
LERIVRWDRGNRYGGVEDRRGMRAVVSSEAAESA